jgi:uncharacterized membrane protein
MMMINTYQHIIIPKLPSLKVNVLYSLNNLSRSSLIRCRFTYLNIIIIAVVVIIIIVVVVVVVAVAVVVAVVVVVVVVVVEVAFVGVVSTSCGSCSRSSSCCITYNHVHIIASHSTWFFYEIDNHPQ